MDDHKSQPVPTGANPPAPQAEPPIKSQDQEQGSQTKPQNTEQNSQTEPQAESQTEKQDSQPTTTETSSTKDPQSTPVEATSSQPQDSQPIATSDVTASNTAAIGATSTKPQDLQPTASDNITDNSIASITSTKPKKSHKGLIIVVAIMLIILGIGGTVYALVFNQDNNGDNSGDQSGNPPVDNATPNQITDFDLAFLEDKEANQLYSPLSIKYALGMLEAGAAGNSQQQIKDAIGSLTPQKYPNNQNMSFANALFINNNLPDGEIKNSYTDIINKQFGAEILRVPFSSAVSINNWVSDKTFGLIKDLLTDEMLKPVGAPEQYFALVNALAIDMEWINKIQPYDKDYSLSFPHINYSSSIDNFREYGFRMLPFNDSTIEVNSLRLAATIHKYDILKELGIDNIRQTVLDKYTDWLNDEDNTCAEGWPTPEVYIEEYLEALGDGGYKTISSSTDFSLYDDNEIKVFAKDLRTYDDITLQYVGIMPKSTSLKDYIHNLTTDKLASTINQLKSLTLENFKDGVITNIVANIPVFKFQDKLDLVNTLQSIGITDVFSETQANLSNLVNDPTGLYIGQAVHQTTVDFSNDGIKASAATALVGGKGSSGCGFGYSFDVPVEKIDLTFDNPYLFLIRDKDSRTIWFIGTVYEPTIYTEPNY